MNTLVDAASEGSAARLRAERRRTPRLRLTQKLSLFVDDPHNGECGVHPALFRDLSLSGACVTTRQALWPGLWVDVIIPAAASPEASGLPETLSGRAFVKRARQRRGQTCEVALRFAPPLADNDGFAAHIAYLLRTQSATPGVEAGGHMSGQ